MLTPIKKMDNYNYTSGIKRFLNWAIDGILISILWFILIIPITKLVLLLGLLNEMKNGEIYDLSYTILPIMFLYYLIFEGLFKTSIGKIITGTKIIRIDGDKIKFHDALKRTIYRFIPLEQFSFFTRNSIGWHDDFSYTRVVNKK